MSSKEDLVFECYFFLCLINSGYEQVDDSILDMVKIILSSPFYKNDPRINRIENEYYKLINYK